MFCDISLLTFSTLAGFLHTIKQDMASRSKAVTLLGAGTQGTRLAFMVSCLLNLITCLTMTVVQDWPDGLSCRPRPNTVGPSQKRNRNAEMRLDSRQTIAMGRGLDDFIKLSARCCLKILVDRRSTFLTHSLTASQTNHDVQCVPESLELKRKIIKQLDQMAEEDTIIASNSSSYTIHEILRDLQLRHRQRFLSLHSCKNPTHWQVLRRRL